MSAREKLRAMIAATAAPVPVPVTGIKGWEGIYVRPLTVGQFDSSAGDAVPKDQRTAYSMARVLCDQSGILLYDENDALDLAELSSFDGSILARISAAMKKANISTDDEAQALGNASPPETTSS